MTIETRELKISNELERKVKMICTIIQFIRAIKVRKKYRDTDFKKEVGILLFVKDML